MSYFISTAGVEVTCSCRSGFAGDGFTCKGNIIQVRKVAFSEGIMHDT